MKETWADKKTNEKLRSLEKRIHSVYDEALQEMAEKLTDYLDKHEKQRVKKAKKVDTGELDALEYTDWLKSEAYKEKHHRAMVEVLSEDTYNTNVIAAQMIRGHMQDVYAINANYAAYEFDKGIGYDTSFSLYNRNTVEVLMRDNIDLLPVSEGTKKSIHRMPDVKVKKKKDIQWNQKKLRNEITQGILQGESVQKIKKRLEKNVGMNKDVSMRNARTATTAAQNAGRLDSFYRARDEFGVDVKKVWIATIDGRTRHSHRLLDGQIRSLDEPFNSEYGDIMEPGDPHADPADVYNCRCKINSQTKYSNFNPADFSRRFVRLDEDMTYEEWKEAKPIRTLS